MMKPRLLDLFCGAGGAAVGYHRAGFDVVGVDISPQPNYPFEFVQDDALERLHWLITGSGGPYWIEDFDAIHASPPCQAYSQATSYHKGARDNHPDLVAPTRDLLNQSGLPWVIENVVGSPLRKDVLLCGEMFGLRLHRHRYFETSDGFLVMVQKHQRHRLKGALTNCHIEDGHARLVAGNYADHQSAMEAMGIDWMNRDELRLAIPPAYTEYIGTQLLAHIAVPA
jgi:DNA (cytosine-5)-methyltransferase 1